MTAHRIYTVTTDGCRTLESEFAERNDLNALRVALEAVSRLPGENIWLLEREPDDDTPDSGQPRLH